MKKYSTMNRAACKYRSRCVQRFQCRRWHSAEDRMLWSSQEKSAWCKDGQRCRRILTCPYKHADVDRQYVLEQKSHQKHHVVRQTYGEHVQVKKDDEEKRQKLESIIRIQREEREAEEKRRQHEEKVRQRQARIQEEIEETIQWLQKILKYYYFCCDYLGEYPDISINSDLKCEVSTVLRHVMIDDLINIVFDYEAFDTIPHGSSLDHYQHLKETMEETIRCAHTAHNRKMNQKKRDDDEEEKDQYSCECGRDAICQCGARFCYKQGGTLYNCSEEHYVRYGLCDNCRLKGKVYVACPGCDHISDDSIDVLRNV